MAISRARAYLDSIRHEGRSRAQIHRQPSLCEDLSRRESRLTGNRAGSYNGCEEDSHVHSGLSAADRRNAATRPWPTKDDGPAIVEPLVRLREEEIEQAQRDLTI